MISDDSENDDAVERLAKEQLAEELFCAYNNVGPNPWKTWDGKDVPRWTELNDQVRAKWLGAAQFAWDLGAEYDPH